MFHDEKAPEPTLAYLLSRMYQPEYPEPLGVFRAVNRPTYNELVIDQVKDAQAKNGVGDLAKLYDSEDSWTV